jgi:hypothetical protein
MHHPLLLYVVAAFVVSLPKAAAALQLSAARSLSRTIFDLFLASLAAAQDTPP